MPVNHRNHEKSANNNILSSLYSQIEFHIYLFLSFSIQLGLVCFRLRGSDELNQKLLSTINASGRLHMVPASVNDKYVIRFCVCAQNATDDDIGTYSGMQK